MKKAGKFLIVLHCVLSFNVIGQECFESFESQVLNSCENCNESELREFLEGKILEIDSTINTIYLSVESLTLNLDNSSDKEKVSELSDFKSTLSLWKNVRKTSSITHSSFYEGGSYYSIQYGVMYLYVSHNIIGFMEGYLEHRRQK